MNQTLAQWLDDARVANKRYEFNPKLHGRVKHDRLVEEKIARWIDLNCERVGNKYRVQLDGRWYETDKAGAVELLVDGWEKFHVQQ